MADPNRFKGAKARQSNKPNTWPTVLTPPAPADIKTLPDVAGDDQLNLVSAEQQRVGLPITIPLWPNAAEFPGEFDIIRFAIDGNDVYLDELEGPITADVDITLTSGRLKIHGPKDITYSVSLSGLPPGEFSLPQEVFVDTIDPNGNNRPGALLLPADLPAEGVTPAYLATHGGVTLTLPRPVDSRPGDTAVVFFGETDDTGRTITVPTTGPITVTYTTAEIQAFGEGDFLLTVQFIDRAGNDTQVSIPRTLSVKTSNPPQLQPPLLPHVGALIDKEDAREGVLVTVPTIVDFHPNDWLYMFVGGIEFGRQQLGVTPIFDLEFMVDYPTLRAGGTDYTAHFKYEIRRGLTGVFHSPETPIAVDFVEPGEPITGPGPEDTTLALPVVTGDSAVNNSLVAADLDGTIHATFPIYAARTTAPATEFIDLYYGVMDGQIADTYELTGTEPDGFMVPMTIERAVIEAYGNGKIPCWYRIRNATNYKQSRRQEVTVNVFSLDGLADPTFTNLFTPPPPSTEAPFISCEQAPWVIVPIRIFDPVNLQDNDSVVIHAVRYLYSGAAKPPTPVAGSEINSLPLGIGPSERLNGFTHNFVLPYFDGDVSRRRGWLEVTWSIIRSGPPPESGTSDPVAVKWDIRSSAATGTCAPITLRKGSLA